MGAESRGDGACVLGGMGAETWAVSSPHQAQCWGLPPTLPLFPPKRTLSVAWE